jgi:hypothetical protein
VQHCGIIITITGNNKTGFINCNYTVASSGVKSSQVAVTGKVDCVYDCRVDIKSQLESCFSKMNFHLNKNLRVRCSIIKEKLCQNILMVLNGVSQNHFLILYLNAVFNKAM